ncbi:uncharacterized protein GIQ15_05919 [Arthroderma uncinatum]|uniref:uncharacterized protein n=1 Tax=Arthroderma uncinatum TaxID=74035 RepID=UPI00144AF362|nr:uncharacterized protein GIQ15_05919 [Arthroderma uncinatum]KAF3480572.1 hypothetical protein GIQ15_05919 [Arthroderma uncinatum]
MSCDLYLVAHLLNIKLLSTARDDIISTILESGGAVYATVPMLVSTPDSGAEAWPQPQPIAVFIRNLKLLRLDLRPDWPGIVPSTLSDSQHNLRRRVQAIEWALFYLFQLWDPELTRNKLQPFFPPLEPLQSSNLRAALFRFLSELTKNGTLGRERILRKAMLEECTGEKFDEILAEFSTIVLRKVVAGSREYRTGAPSLSLPASKRGPPSDTHNLLPMIIAYRASLHSMIDQKNELNSTCRDLKQFLHLKSNELANSRRMPKPLASEIRNQQQFQDSIKRSWHGDVDWATTILNGDSQACSEPLLEMDFSQVWSGMKKVEVKEGLESQSHPDLLADLDDRLLKQRSRLQGWQKFKESLDLDSLRLRLQRPENADLPQAAPEDECGTTDSPVEHVDMTKEATQEPAQETVQETTQERVQETTQETIQETIQETAEETAQEMPDAETIVDSPVAHPEPESSHTPEDAPGNEAKIDTIAGAVEEPSAVTREDPVTSDSSDFEPDLTADISTEDMLAMQLGLSPLVKSSTPKLPKSSPLANRLASSGDTNGAQDEENQQAADDKASRATTLLERTRQSMLFVSASTPRPWKPLSDNRRQSQLLLPGDPFETPEKRAESKGDSELEVSGEDPYSDYIDYDSVFKSRPKVASSPIPFETAQQETHESHDEDYSLSDLGLESSPLGKMQGRPRAQTSIRHPVVCLDDKETADSKVDSN